MSNMALHNAHYRSRPPTKVMRDRLLIDQCVGLTLSVKYERYTVK